MKQSHLNITITPRASKNQVLGFHGDGIKVKIAAPPVDGAANEALIKFMAAVLGLKASDLSIIAGQTGRRKILRIEGLDSDETFMKLSSAMPEK